MVQNVDHFKKSLKIILDQAAELSDQYSDI
jgi:hypothetical protein